MQLVVGDSFKSHKELEERIKKFTVRVRISVPVFCGYGLTVP